VTRKIPKRKSMMTMPALPLAALAIALWPAPSTAETGAAAFVRPVRQAGIAGNLSAMPLQGKSGFAQSRPVTRITAKMPAGFRMTARTSPLQAASSCAGAHCGMERTGALPAGFEAERLKRTVEIYAGDIDMGRTPSRLSARMGYIKQSKNVAEPTRRGALSLCDRHIDNCRAEINPHEMQLNPIAKELIFNRDRAGKSFDEHVGVKLTYQFR
jgi:hypothetical protein